MAILDGSFCGLKDNFLQPSQYKYFTETGKVWSSFHSSVTLNFFKFFNSLQLFLIIDFMLKSIVFMRGSEYLTKALKMLNRVVRNMKKYMQVSNGIIF